MSSWDKYTEVEFGGALSFGHMLKFVSTSQDPRAVCYPEKYSDTLYFHMQDGRVYRMWHEQDCCENVTIEDICGDMTDLTDAMIIKASLETKRGRGVDDVTGYEDSNTWSFYRIMTNKGEVVIRWHGSSNGYYSETVTFALLD